MKNAFFMICFASVFFTYGQNNLLDTSTWTIGNGSISTEFSRYGPTSKNIRELDYGPHSSTSQVIIWKGLADNVSTLDGGFLTSYKAIDPSKKYRLTIWLRKINSNDGISYFGFNALDINGDGASLALDDLVNNNPYFISRSWSFPTFNEWYLFVAYVYPSTYASSFNEAKVYRTDGTEISNFTPNSYKFASTATEMRLRTFLKDPNPLDELHFYAPTIYEVNGQEPTIQELLGGSNSSVDNETPTSPTLTSTGNTDTTVNLSWSGATDNIGVTGYRLYSNGGPIANLGNVTTYAVTGLAADTTFQFKLKALDAAGNESANSNLITVTTDVASNGNGGSPSGTIWSETNSIASYSGKVMVGTTSIPSEYKMAIDGKLITEEVKVQLSNNWPDYVFEKDYDLPTLKRVQDYIERHGHLPNIPSAKEVEQNGMELGEMNRLLLEKIEELTLYVLELKNENEAQHLAMQKLKDELENLKP